MKTNIEKIFLILVVSLFIANSNIYAYELNGIKYSVSGAWSYSEGKNVYHATVEPSNYSGDITIPDKVFLTFKDGGGNEISDSLRVVSVEDNAFYQCENLTSINFEGSINIGLTAFKGCTGLTTLDLENVSAYVGSNAFMNCSRLKSIYLGKNVTLGTAPFVNDTLVEIFQIYLGANNSYKATSFRKSLKKAIIVEGSTNIGMECFSECINLDTIIIPNTVSELGSSAFKACKSLNAINLKDNDIETIPNYCFFNCINLKSCELPHSLTKIGQEAFAFCRNLDSLIIPQSVSQVGKMAFKECTNILSIDLSNNDLTSIPQYSFYNCKNLKTFNCPNNLKEIGYQAFYGDTALRRIILPPSVTNVGNYAFFGCKNLTIFVPASATKGSDTFKNCKKVIYYTDRMGDYWFNDTILTGYTGTETDLHLPATHNGAPYVIGASAFANLEAKITSVHIPSSVTSIKANAFKGCRTLKSVILPADLTDIATTAFANCDSITAVTIGMHAETPSIKALFASSKNKTLKEFTLQQGSTIMGTKKGGNNYLIFANDTVLEKITIPYSVKIHADSAFMNCKNLYSINIGGLSTDGEEPHDMQRRLPAGSGLNPDEIVADIYIGEAEFQNNTRAKYITWQYIVEIPSKAFEGCTGLEECIIPPTVKEIGENAFANCTGLKKVKIPSGVETVDENAFANCSNIEDLTVECDPAAFIPSGSSNGFQFSGCNHIRKLKYNSYIDSNHNIPALTTLFASSLSTIEELEFLSGSDEVYWTSRLPSASDDLILGMPSLKSVILPEGVGILNLGAFKGCASLKKIDLPNSLTKIKNRAFMNSGLNSIILPMNISSIEGRVLTNCPNLQKVGIGCVDLDTIPESLCADCPNLNEVNYLYYGKAHCSPTVISAYAFSNCTSLRVISIPESVEVINEEAYNNCIGAKQLVVESFEPPVCYYDSHYPFKNVNRDHTLWIPKGSVESYRTAEVWKTFFDNIYYNWEATMLQREQEINAEVEKNSAIISWTEEENAGSYDLALNEVGTESSSQTYTIPTYTAENNAPAFAPRKIISEEVPGIKFSVSGLKLQTTYYYTITARDEARNVLRSYAGSFTTDATEDVKVVNSGTSSESKILRNGQVVIQKGDKTYTLTGQEVK